MAMNPMQRRARNSFLIGFLVALIIMALVVLLLLNRIKTINEEKEALLERQKKVYVAADDLESGQVITMEDFTIATVQTSMDTLQVIDEYDFKVTDEDGAVVLNEDDMEISKEVMMKIDVPAGAIVTKDMIVATGEEIEDSQRTAEYNMILLPSHLKNGDYIDIRLSLSTGQDYVVLSKKRVFGTTEQSVWLRLNEDEILTLNNAIVESYFLTGSKLYAFQYVEPGMQEASSTTYVPNTDVVDMIRNSPNVTEKAKVALAAKLEAMPLVRPGQIQQAIQNALDQGIVPGSAVETGNSEEIEKIVAARQAYVQELDGTDAIGYTR